jgi:glycosyltransferase involved in cell wall biosynthesis
MTASAITAASPLANRLRAAARVLFGAEPSVSDPGTLLDLLVRDIQRGLSAQRMWLLYIAVSTVFPTAEELRAALRAVELLDADGAALWLLDTCLAAACGVGWPDCDLEIVEDVVVVEVDFSAQHDLHTGIQRVVRSTLPHWDAEHDILATAWTPTHSALRTLEDDERARVLQWAQWRAAPSARDVPPGAAAPWTIVVPWRCVLVLPEVPGRESCERLAAIAELSGNRVVAIGYDCIPVVSADLVPPAETNRFVKYLAAVKHMRRVAGISVSATTEFDGFARMLDTQGLPGPTVVECALPADTPDELKAWPPPDGTPLIVCVGSFEPRKNQLSVLHAAETLWREGLRFDLRFYGGGGAGWEFPAMVRRLALHGRSVSVAIAVSDADLDAAYASARFTVFNSIHEGYGLPVAESLAHGTPVITADYGSTREVGAAGGAVLIDPRDDLALIDAMRELLTDDNRVEKLRAEILERPTRSWNDYARELWACLVESERVSAG